MTTNHTFNKTKRAKALLLLAFFTLLSASAVKANKLIVFTAHDENEYVPMCVYNGPSDMCSRSQFVIPAYHLTKMTNGTITSLKFYTGTDNHGTTVENVVVYLTTTNQPVISEFVDPASATTVFNGRVMFTNTFVEISFRTPYVYTGGNLLIGCDNNLVNNGSVVLFQGEQRTGTSVSGIGPIGSTLRPTRRDFSPKTEFTYTIPAPINLTATPDPNNSTVASLSWTENGVATQWEVQYGTNEAFAAGSYTSLTITDTPSADLSSLSLETTYYARVRSVDGSNQSPWSNSISFTTSTIPPPPTNITASNQTENSATLSWTAPEIGLTITGYTYQYKLYCDATWSTEVTTTNTSVTLTGLTDTRKYTFRVKTIYNNSGSLYATVNFCTAVPLPYVCSFEDSELFDWSNLNVWTWVNAQVGGSGPSSVQFFSGHWSFQFFCNDGPQYLISPRFNCTEALKVSFYHLNTLTPVPTFQLGYSTTTNDPADFTWGDEITASYGLWGLYESASLPAGTRYVAIKYDHSGTISDYWLYLDNFTFEYTAKQRPSNLTVSGLTEHDATLSWTAPNNQVTGYAYQFKPATDSDWPAETIIQATNVTYQQLTTNTEYNFRVKALYANGYASLYASTSFITEGEMETLPHFQGFEDGMGGWRIVNGCGSRILNINENDEAYQYVYNGSYSFVFAEHPAAGTVGDPYYLISPQFEGSPKTVSFYYKNVRRYIDGIPYSYKAVFQVGYSTTTKDLNAFTWGEAITSNTQWQQYVNDFPDGTKYIAIKKTAGWWLFVDNISIQGPCPTPTDLGISVDGTDVTVSWSGNADGYYQLCLNDDNNYTYAYSPTYTYTNLVPFDTYTVKVRSHCYYNYTTEWSEWSDPLTFTFEPTCPTPHNLQVSVSPSGTEATASWSGDAGAWQLCLNDDDNYIEVNEPNYTFTGLEPFSTYTVKVRSHCLGSYYVGEWSGWTDPVTITPRRTLTLANDADNSDAISEVDGKLCDVILSGYTLYGDGSWNTLCLPFNLNNFTGTPLDGATVKTLENSTCSNDMMTMNFTGNLSAIEAGKPYIVKLDAAYCADADLVIRSTADWNAFAANVTNGNSYSGKLVKLAADIYVTTMAGGEHWPSFSGTFDGCGHTVTVDYYLTDPDYCALFRSVDGATIRNLRVAGDIQARSYYSAYCLAGLVSGCYGGTNIQNCRSSVTITSDGGGDMISGFIASVNDGASVTISNCLFDGKLLFEDVHIMRSGGFIGRVEGFYNDPEAFPDPEMMPPTTSVNISNCLFAPTEVVINDFDFYDVNTFYSFEDMRVVTLTNSYFTQSFGDAQSTYTNATGTALQALLGDGWEVRNGKVVPKIRITNSNMRNPMFTNVIVSNAITNITTPYADFIGSYAPFSNNGLLLDAHNPNGDAQHAALGISYLVNGCYSTEGLFIDAEMTTPVTTIPFADDGTVTLFGNHWPPFVQTGTNEYTIHTATGWDLFCDALQDNDTYNRFIGKTVKLDADINVTRMAGSSGHEFGGTFDGQGHTLTVSYQNNNGTVRTAPFSYVDGATIQNLIVAGNITGTASRAAGIVGETGSSLSHVTNCVCSVNVSGGSYTGGISVGGKVEITGCVFNGTIVGTNCSGGFVGWSTSSLVIRDCLFAPQEGSTITGGTFYYNGGGEITPTNSYYTVLLGTEQGHPAINDPDITPFDTPTGSYNVSNLIVYLNGLMYGDTFYYDPDFVPPFEQTGTDEYTIHNAMGWDLFCDALQDNATYNRFIGKTVKLDADISVVRMASSSGHEFGGTFDGQSHTLTVSYQNNNNNVPTAPFSYINGATIQNLIVAGNITGTAWRAAGIVGETGSILSHITNCVSSVNVSGGYFTGGISVSGMVEITGCVFTGTIVGTNCSGGFVGWSNSALVIRDCLFAPQEGSTINGGTFYYNGEGEITPINSYYTVLLGTEQGHPAISDPAITPLGSPTGSYNVSNFIAYLNGLMYGDTFYYDPDFVPFVQTATDEYTIYTATGWDLFCDALQDNDTYNRFIGKTVKLDADISVTRMAGGSYHDFMGTFNGQGHTLTVSYGSASSPIADDKAAPFVNVEVGCIIKNLHVAGDIYTSAKYAGGLVGTQYGAVSIENCHISTIIHSSTEGDGTHGGIVGQNGSGSSSSLTITGCLFDGKLLTTGTTANCGGLVGWRGGTCTIGNSLYAPAAIAEGETEVLANACATFCRNGATALTNCYYTRTLGTEQGIQAITHEAVSAVGTAIATYDVSGISIYVNGMQHGEVFYYDPDKNFLLSIDGYSTGSGGWNLLASPVADTVVPTVGNGFLTNTYDLYRFNPSNEDNEWENYKAANFSLENGRGYIYANSGDVTLVFVGTPNDGNGEVALVYDANDEHKCWNLVGNPFPCNATLDRVYYVLNEDRTGINPVAIPATTPVPPFTAVFVKAVAVEDKAVFTKVTQ